MPLHELWKHVPFLLKLQGLLLAVIGMACLIVVNVIAPQGYQRLAFAIPAPDHQNVPWQLEVNEFGARMSQAFGVRRTTANQFAGWILEASERQDIDPELLASLVHTESTFRTEALSPVGAIGPAQVRPNFWSGFCGTTHLNDPAENIYCGAQVFSHLRDRCGDDRCALEAYNIGIDGERPQAAARYVAKIDTARNLLRALPVTL